MEKELFRKQSLERISSPEQLQDYMQVTSPGTWFVLGAVMCLLTGLIVCSSVGRLESRLSLSADVQDGVILAPLDEAQKKVVEPGMPLRIAGQETAVEYLFEDGGGTAAAAHLTIPDGRYDAEIVTEAISPISFLLN